MKFVARVLLFPVVLLSAFLVLMLKWTLNLSAFVLALPMQNKGVWGTPQQAFCNAK